MKSYHQELPSTELANNEGRKNVRSDHVPILTITPEGFKILSWNVMQSSKAGCGFAPEDNVDANWDEIEEIDKAVESTEYGKSRHKKIIDSLLSFVKNEEIAPDFIALQEISFDIPTLLKNIPNELAEYGYTCVKIGEEIANGWGYGQGIILYKHEKFELKIDNEQGTNQFTHKGLLSGVKATFKQLSNQNDDQSEEFTLLSIHAAFRFMPNEHEVAIKKFAQEATKKGAAVIVGDFNCTIAPPNSELRNITTSVSAPRVHPHNIQGAYSIDGAIYLTSIDFQQLEIFHLNSNTGNIYSAEQLAILTSENKLQDEEVNQLRMAISIDTKDSAKVRVNGKTLLEYEQELSKAANDNSLLVRRAVNLNNGKGIGLSVSKDLFDSFAINEQQFQFVKKLDFKTKQVLSYCVLAFDYQINEFVEIVGQAIERQQFLASEDGKLRLALAGKILNKMKIFLTREELSDNDKNIKDSLWKLQHSLIHDDKETVSTLLEQTKRYISYLKNSRSTALSSQKKEQEVIDFLNSLINPPNPQNNSEKEKESKCVLQ